MLDVFFDKWWRLGGLFGILFFIMVIVGISIQGEYPDFDAPNDEVRDWFADNGEQFIVGDYLLGLTFLVLFPVFLVSLFGLLSAAEGGAAVWSRLALLGGFLYVVMAAVITLFVGALAFGFGVSDTGDDSMIRLALTMDHFAFYRVPFALAPFLLGSSLVILRTGVLWRWLAVAGLIVGLASLGSPLGALDSDVEGLGGGLVFLGFMLTNLWILLVSINMILKREAPASA
jgi:hypothetical protein